MLCAQHKPAIVAIYEDDFNFLSKMCLTRMRELAWQLAQTARDAGAIVIAHGSDATDHAKEYLQNGVDFVLVGKRNKGWWISAIRSLPGVRSDRIPGVIHLDAEGKLSS